MDMSGTSTMSGMSSSATSSSSSSMTSSMTMAMAMVFTNSHSTPLFSSTWTPTTSGQYAGTCIFLIILAIIGRCLMAFKAAMERRWLAIALDRRYVVVAGKKQESALTDADSDTIKTGTLTCQGVDETVRVVRQVTTETQPWRFSVDLPRAVLAFVVTGVSYLLMLAVMTMNVGYFMSVLAGTFIGELAVGRYIVHWSEH